jgi:hypothetical protein
VLKIGDFSRIARVSCRLLRYYDELGLLKPAQLERDSGEFEVDRIDVEVGFVLQADLQSEVRLASGEPLSVRELPAVERMATCVRIGLPERAHLITGNDGAVAGLEREFETRRHQALPDLRILWQSRQADQRALLPPEHPGRSTDSRTGMATSSLRPAAPARDRDALGLRLRIGRSTPCHRECHRASPESCWRSPRS